MELSVKDRLYLPTFLPARGTFKDFNLKKEILRKIALDDEEVAVVEARAAAQVLRHTTDHVARIAPSVLKDPCQHRPGFHRTSGYRSIDRIIYQARRL